MMITKYLPYPLVFCLAICMLSLIACVNHNQADQENHNIPINEEIPYYTTHTIDTTLRLRFTTGVRSILEDSRGNIWFGSHQEGVALYDGEKLTYFTQEDGLSDKQIRSIYESTDGTVWFEGGEGISSYNGGNIVTHTVKNYLAKGQWQAGENDLWFKGDESVGYNLLEGEPGVYRYDGGMLTFHTFPLTPKAGEEFYYSVSTPFVKGRNGRYWFGTYGGVIGYDGAVFTVLNKESPALEEVSGDLHIRSIFEDSQGNLWIGNNGIGVLLYDGKSTINFSRQQGLISDNSLLSGGYRSPAGSLEHVFAIGEDRRGNIWFGDRDTGAWRYDGKTLKNFTPADGLTTTHIWQIYLSKQGELWFAMGDGSVCRFNGSTFDRIF